MPAESDKMEVDQEEKWDWVSKNKEAKKRILKKTFWLGSRPIKGSRCKVLIKEINGSWDTDIIVGTEFEFTIGYGDSRLEGLLERCLITMNKNEESFLQLDNVSLTVKLLDFTCPEIPEHEYDVETNIKVATEHKEKGVEHYKRNKIVEAYAQFRRAARLIIFSYKTEPAVLPLYITVCNNIALCHMKLGRPEDGIAICNKVLEHDTNNVKALFRRSVCYNMVRDFENAYADLGKVLELDPNNKHAKEMMPAVRADIRDMNIRYKHIVKKMFNL